MIFGTLTTQTYLKDRRYIFQCAFMGFIPFVLFLFFAVPAFSAKGDTLRSYDDLFGYLTINRKFCLLTVYLILYNLTVTKSFIRKRQTRSNSGTQSHGPHAGRQAAEVECNNRYMRLNLSRFRGRFFLFQGKGNGFELTTTCG